jgi:threonine aldolase
MIQPIDLRSDTVTRPGEAMRQAMAEAVVGDDLLEGDPTVRRLEASAATLLGKEAALLVPSGTMANLVAVMTHTRPGEEILLGDESHIFHYEAAGAARIAMCLAHPLANLADGSLEPETVRAAIREPQPHVPATTLLCLENTQNRVGGAVLPQASLDALTSLAHSLGLAVHLDGARIFNAAVASGVPAARIARDADSVSFCLSKGLGCPVGSLLCGSSGLIDRARRNRRMLGGGMRQAGVLAAAGLYALEHNVERLEADHRNARRLAAGLRRHAAFSVTEPETNIVVVRASGQSVAEWLDQLKDAGVLAVPFGSGRFRMVTHLDVNEADIDEALGRIDRVMGAAAA